MRNTANNICLSESQLDTSLKIISQVPSLFIHILFFSVAKSHSTLHMNHVFIICCLTSVNRLAVVTGASVKWMSECLHCKMFSPFVTRLLHFPGASILHCPFPLFSFTVFAPHHVTLCSPLLLAMMN